MAPIVDGQPVNAATDNAQKLDRISDDTTIGVLSVANTNPLSGASVTNTQREHNAIASFVGKALNTVAGSLPSWLTNNLGLSSDNVKQRVEAIDAAFDPTTGHAHAGNPGDGGPIFATSITAVPLQGYILQGIDLTGVTGLSTDVSTELTGKSESTNSSTLGVVSVAPYNKVLLRQASGVEADDEITDAFGNMVYGRLTYSVGVWTLSYYVLISSVETPYTFASATDVRWYYQELYNPLQSPPTYSAMFNVPSDNATADVVPATASIYGKVVLGSTAPADVGASPSAGTVTGEASNADHVHEGVHSVGVFGDPTKILGDVDLEAGTNITLTRTGQKILIDATTGGPGSYTAPSVTRLLTTGTTTGRIFFCASFNATAGATYTNNGQTFTVLATGTGATVLHTLGAGAPLSSGTLTKTTGTGDVAIVFTSSIATATYTTPTVPAPLYLRPRMVGGGGGGGGSGALGTGTAGGLGTDTYFGSNLLTAAAGQGGSATAGQPGAGGAVVVNSPAINIASFTGGYGQCGTSDANSNPGGGMGGTTPFGGASRSGGLYGAPAVGIANTGAGGSGGGLSISPTVNSGSGGGAGGYIEALIGSPGVTYQYVIGLGGAAGTAGTNGTVGAAGATGVIIVEEHYQ